MDKRKTMLALAAVGIVFCTAPAFAEAESIAEGKIFNIYAWKEEFRTYFEKYYTVPEGITVNWTIVPKVQGRYQDALDRALLLQDKAGADEKIDLFMADPDSMLKYVTSDVTQDVTALGVTDFSNAYEYTVQACTDENGAVKGAACWLHPGVMVCRRTFAKEVLGTEDPDALQTAVCDWETFTQTAKAAAEKEYLMTPSYASTYAAFAQHMTSPWVNENGDLQLDEQIAAWIDQCTDFIENESTQPVGIMEDDATEQALAKVGKGLFFFGADEYINGIMWKSQENRNEETTGDWVVCKGPAGYTVDDIYLMAASGSDNPTMLADVINTFLNNAEVCTELVRNEKIFTNNKTVNDSMKDDPALANEFLGNQNPFSAFIASAEDTVWQNRSMYDSLLNTGLLEVMKKYCAQQINLTEMISSFKDYVSTVYPTLNVSEFGEALLED